MGFKCGIIGLPNVGKSTLFNALTATQQAESANYPFCTIEPNIGRVAVPDERLEILAKIACSKNIIQTQLEFVDIAGLVRGASKGEGLGNQFLGHIREVDAIIHVVRCFIDSDITHVEDTIDPVRDVELIETELIFADLESIEKRIPALEKKAKLNDKLAIDQISLLKRVKEKLLEGKLAIETDIGIDTLKSLQLLTSKPILYVCNVLEDEALNGNILSNDMIKFAEKNNRIAIIISSKIESEISMLDTQGEKDDFISDLGLSETGLSQIIRKGYNLLNLSTFFTIGPKEARSWTIQNGSQAPSAAGVIHSDFERGFIRAEVIAYDDYIKYNGEAGSKEAGKFRVEGKEYIVRDGDVLHFRFNV